MITRILLTAGAAGLACLQALAATPPAASDPWAQVPALPTVCYSTQDQWPASNDAAIESVREMLAAQEEKNTALDQQMSDAMSENPYAFSQALQQAMLEDPANAQAMMEKMTQTGLQAQTELPAQLEKEKQLEAESKTLIKQYNTALDKAMQPAVARWGALQKNMGWEVSQEFALMPDPSWPESAWQEWAGIQKDRDAAYVANCAHWWSANGAFAAYMKRYKDYLVRERIPYEKKFVDEFKLNNYKMMNVPADDFRTTTDIKAAIDYMTMAWSVYRERNLDRYCKTLNVCE